MGEGGSTTSASETSNTITMDEDELAGALVRFLFIAETLSNYLRVVDAGEAIYCQFPPALKECLEQERSVTPDQEIATLAIAIAQLSPKARQQLRETFQLGLQMMTTRIDQLSTKTTTIDRDDVDLVVDLVKVVKQMPPKSKSWLRGWVQQAKEKMGAGFLILWGNGTKHEARHRYTLSEETLKEVGIRVD